MHIRFLIDGWERPEYEQHAAAIRAIQADIEACYVGRNSTDAEIAEGIMIRWPRLFPGAVSVRKDDVGVVHVTG